MDKALYGTATTAALFFGPEMSIQWDVALQPCVPQKAWLKPSCLRFAFYQRGAAQWTHIMVCRVSRIYYGSWDNTIIIIIILFVIECLAVEILWYLAEFNLTRSKGVFDLAILSSKKYLMWKNSNSDAQNILAPDVPDVSEIQPERWWRIRKLEVHGPSNSYF